MNRLRHFLLLCISILLIVSCKPRTDYASANKLAVQWGLITNFTDEPNVFEARFKLVNNSGLTLDDRNWALFFSMSPRPVLKSQTPQPATLHHINGDWYKLVPDKGFLLAPGDEVTINYRGTEAVIKETDRPLGLYFVFYDDAGKEESIAEVEDYTWDAFTTAEQINRSRNDREPIPTAAWAYKNNQGLPDVPSSGLMPVIPSPVEMQTSSGTFEVSPALEIFHDESLAGEAAYLAEMLQGMTGKVFRLTTERPAQKCITLKLEDLRVNDVSAEAYRLKISGDGIMIAGNDGAGVFYGIQTLRALVPLEVLKKSAATFALPHVSIEDAPRFSFRGLHLDVARNFQTKETILRLLDLLSFYKINQFLFYTTEDEGWRLEIKDLPELTEVGAVRKHASGKEAPVLHPSYGSGPVEKAEGRYGHGYYSREDFIEILKYADARHIRVIPELNFPGHARAAIKAMEARYERLMGEGKEAEANAYRLIDPDDKSVYLSAQGYKDNVVCVARESTFRFYEKVVDEIASMYKDAGLTLEAFHTGGDEVPEGAWTASPLAAELMKQHPEIRDPKNLQSYFFHELLKRLKPRGLEIHGWEEVALTKTPEGKYIPNPAFVDDAVVPYIWNNLFDPDLGYRLANAGYNVVLCNVSNFYFDLAYSKDPGEPGLYWAGFVDVRDSWAFAPYDMFKTTTQDAMGQQLDLETAAAGKAENVMLERLKLGARKNILGVEAQVWSETIKGREMLEYYMLPKLMGFAESAWSRERRWESIQDKVAREKEMQVSWNIFANTLAKRELPRLSYLNGGYHYRIPTPGAVIAEGKLLANVEYPGLTIRYTLDGSDPDEDSPAYTGPVATTNSVKLRSYDAAGKASRVVEVRQER